MQKAVFESNYYRPSDPDARLTKKPGKPFDLYYKSQVSVDTASHFITYIQAFPANAADNVSLPQTLDHIVGNMQENNIQVNEILADLLKKQRSKKERITSISGIVKYVLLRIPVPTKWALKISLSQ